MTRYNSKIGWGLATIMVILVIGTTVAAVFDGIWSGFIINIMVLGL